MADSYFTDAAFAKILGDLYAGTLDHEAWDRAMVAVADMVRASGALLFAFNPSSGAVLRDEIHRFDPRIVDDYRRYWTFHDSRRSTYLDSPVCEPVREVTLPKSNWHRSPILNEFLLPVDAPYNMAAWLHKTQTKAVALALQGTRRRGPFDDRDVDLLRRTLPHIRRALEIRDRLEAANAKIDTLNLCMDRVTFGIVALDADGSVLHANATAESMLRDGRTLHFRADRSLILRELTRRKDRSADNAAKERLIRIDRGPARLPISVVVIPVREVSNRWVSTDPGCVLFIFDPESHVAPRLEVLAEELDVTAREAEIAALLSMGLELAETATRLRISIHTVRTHLKSLYGKTGIRSQAELVRRVLAGPSAHRAG